MLTTRFERLAQAFRIFAEQSIRFPGLFLVDGPEAVGNLDHAVDGILNAYHGIYDAARQDHEVDFDFYANPIVAFLLRVRNARHHNHANGIRSIYHCARREPQPIDYLLVSFPAGENEAGGSFVEYFVSWSDIRAFMDTMPEQYAASVSDSFRLLGANQFEPWCANHEYTRHQIFINAIPIFTAAGTECFNAIAHRVEIESTEAEALANIFQTVDKANFLAPDYVELTSRAFWPN